MPLDSRRSIGDVGDVIAEHAEEENYDMIVMGSPLAGTCPATLLGSVTMTAASE